MASKAYLFAKLWFIAAFVTFPRITGFAPISSSCSGLGCAGLQSSKATRSNRIAVELHVAAAKVSEADAEKVIQVAKSKINGDKTVKESIGTVEKVVSVVGYGSPSKDVVAVRFTAQFKKAGGLASLQRKPSAKLDTSKSGAGRGAGSASASRGVMVAQVAAKSQGGKLISLSVMRDGGWGKTLEVKC